LKTPDINGAVLNHCSSSPHPEDRINGKHCQQIMNHDPSRNVPHFLRHEHTTFSGFIKARERPHSGGSRGQITNRNRKKYRGQREKIQTNRGGTKLRGQKKKQRTHGDRHTGLEKDRESTNRNKKKKDRDEHWKQGETN
jgi:hypothetical protein